MGALSSWWRSPEPQPQPTDCLHREYSSCVDRKCHSHHPFAGKWLLPVLSIAVPYIKCHSLFHCHEKDLCSPVNPFLRMSEQPLGKGCIHPSVLHFCPPISMLPLLPGHLGLGVIDSSFTLLLLPQCSIFPACLVWKVATAVCPSPRGESPSLLSPLLPPL